MELKSAGFGDMVSKYIALVDWQVSHLLTGEHYCERVAGLTRYATDRIMSMADKITLADEEAARAVFESLLMTGIAMSFTLTSRPGSGTEHIMAHFWECLELLEGKVPNFNNWGINAHSIRYDPAEGVFRVRYALKNSDQYGTMEFRGLGDFQFEPFAP